MTINKNLVPEAKYSLKCPYAMSPIGICVHNTANDAAAKGEISYMVTNPNQTSFHFAVDDIEVWQGLPLDRNGWHAGDGTNGDGNRKHIGIEICYSKSGGERFTKAEDNAAELIAQLLKERGWGVDRVKKHQDFSGKYCPHRTLDLGWDRFINKIKSKLGGSTMPNVYKGYDLSNAESMKVAVDMLVRVMAGEFVEKPAHEKALNDAKSFCDTRVSDAQINQNQLTIATIRDGLGLPKEIGSTSDLVSAIKALIAPPIQPQTPSGSTEPSLPATIDGGWVENGMSIEITEGNKKTTINYAKA